MENKERLEKDRMLVEARLNKLIPVQNRLTEAMRYSLLAGGKRLRPILTLEFCRACGGDYLQALDCACGVEMLHTYSLIHDDLPSMDNDDIRRGKPTNHVVYGEWLALLAGDALQAEAFGALLRAPIPSKEKAEAARVLSEAAGWQGICGGQFLDLDGEGKKLTADQVMELNAGKTAALWQAACEIGCICGEKAEKRGAARAYGGALGLAFQLQDDLLDMESTTEALGKPVGSDEKNGKSTFVSLFGVEACRELVKKETKKAVAVLRESFEDPDFLVWLTESLVDRKN